MSDVALPLAVPRYADFAGRVGSTFAVAALDSPGETPADRAGEPTEFRLLECSSHVVAGGYSSFSLRFRGPAHGPMAQSIFVFSAPGFATAALFAVPVSADTDGIDYDVTFNQVEG